MFSDFWAKFRWLFMLLAAALPILTPIPTGQYWQFEADRLTLLNAAQKPAHAELVLPSTAGDLDGDGQPECLELESGSLRITNCASENYWSSPQEWRVSEALAADVNHDGLEEAVLVVWRVFQPWPVDRFMPFGGRILSHQNQEGQSCQVILIGWKDGRLREIWAGSALANPISNLRAADLNNDGLIEIAVLEADYDSKVPGGRITVWRWVGFGFSLLDRAESSSQQFSIVRDGQKYWLFSR